MEEAIRNEIRRFVDESDGNRFPDRERRYYEEPLVGFSDAADALYLEYKTIIGPFHLTPQEMYEQSIGEGNGEARSVISWILPVSEATRKSNRKETRLPSLEWAQTRTYGTEFNDLLARHLVRYLESLGGHAIVPEHSPAMRIVKDPRAGLASSWSERHAAFAAGLGTFSLNCGFITERGIAVNCGSVVTDLPLAPSRRTETAPGGHCLYLRDGSCGACIKRCPAGAISARGLDKMKCYAQIYGTAPQSVGQLYGVEKTGCGLCQTRVPCEAQVPRTRK